MNIFKKSKQRQQKRLGYNCNVSTVIWENKNVSWNWISYGYGIRNSNKLQIFPIWNMSHNNQRSLLFGIWKIYFKITYHRNKSFNQSKYRFMGKKLRKLYQLID